MVAILIYVYLGVMVFLLLLNANTLLRFGKVLLGGGGRQKMQSKKKDPKAQSDRTLTEEKKLEIIRDLEKTVDQEETVDKLIQFIYDPSPQVKAASARILLASNNVRVVKPLWDYSKEIDNELIRMSRNIVGEDLKIDIPELSTGGPNIDMPEPETLQDRKVLAGLFDRLETEKNCDVIYALSQRIIELKDIDAVEPLFRASKKLDQELINCVQKLKVSGISKRGIHLPEVKYVTGNGHGPTGAAPHEDITSTLDQLEKTLDSENQPTRGLAVRQLRTVQDRRAIPLLKKAFNHKNEYVRAMAAEIMGELQEKELAPFLIKYFDGETDTVKYSILQALGKMGEKSILPFLKKQLKSKNLNLARFAQYAIEALNS